MFDIILACLFIYIFVMVLMGMFVVCVYSYHYILWCVIYNTLTIPVSRMDASS